MEIGKKIRTGTSKGGAPKFLGRRIKHKMVNEGGKDVWYLGLVVSVLDDNEFDGECKFKVLYNEFDDKYDIELVKEWRMKCVVIEGKDDGFVEVEVRKKQKSY